MASKRKTVVLEDAISVIGTFFAHDGTPGDLFSLHSKGCGGEKTGFYGPDEECTCGMGDIRKALKVALKAHVPHP